jgi:ketosteroid isomerase-like protein
VKKQQLSGEEMLAAYSEHARAEFAKDLDRTMDFVSDDPVFEWPGLNLRVAGRDAVRHMYSLLLSNHVHTHSLSQRAVAVGEGVIMVEYVVTYQDSAGVEGNTAVMALVGFEGGKIHQERTYSHPAFTALVDNTLGGEDFRRYPGVSELEYDSALAECVPPLWVEEA